MLNFETMSPNDLRAKIRAREITGPTAGMAKGYTQANLAILKKEHAFDFLLFCQRNPKSCPLVDVTEIGSYTPSLIGNEADIRTDIPKYRIYKDGVFTDEVTDIKGYWEEDMVAFLIGCSFTFETPLLEAGIPIRHIEEECNVPMYKTNIACEKAGVFEGPMVVSMRPMSHKDAIRAVQITSRFPGVHGAPIHIGDPAQIGISDIEKPDFGDAVTIKEGEIPVFWACGVTPQAVAMQSKPSIMITHAPGCMFISDLKDEKLSVL
ncbi:putative hydro-lyase [Psychrobacillus lasiicapitis]|uniref:Putative hydro-lyase FG382_01630 n=1 Tax=Psychrobacillus lasiicapitis TaxID=1636719 RepID=A0A544TI74_9BACI|nr:putative hydro-lyase [Psychrobacillus lasiicapitis]TQR17157.1 putative hydro-lyase [Psychrobacillus lasiicapitis]